MCRGQIQWWRSRTVSPSPVAGWNSSAGEGSKTSSGPFSQWTQCDCPTSGPEKLCCPWTWRTPLQSQCCSWCEWGECRRVSPEIHDYLHCFERVKLQIVKTVPDSQLLNPLSLGRLVTVLNETDVICKLHELDRGVFRCPVVPLIPREHTYW